MNAPTPALTPSDDRDRHGLPMVEFVAMMASLIAVNALGTDMMLPALPAMAHDLGVTVENHRQLIIAVYIASFGVGQLIWGPIADRYGRRAVLLSSLLIYAATSFLAAHAGSFELMLGARMLQGLSSASTRVLTSSVIRDCYSGRHMAKIMSLIFMTFLAVPIVAPTLGQAVLLVAPWQWIFYILGGFSLAIALWAGLRLPETLDPRNRMPISLFAIGHAVKQVLTNRYSIGYCLCSGLVYGGLLGFLNSSQQILAETFHAPELFTLCFATVGVFMGAAALINSRIVERYGMRLLSHAALLGLILLCAMRLVMIMTGHETLAVFVILNGFTFMVQGLTGSNFNSMAMEPMGHIAGTAASIQGFLQTMIGTAIGLAIGQSFSGTTLPLTLGWELAALASLVIVLITERGRLFHGQNAPPAKAG